jgi:PAS domain S-box-containing protein
MVRSVLLEEVLRDLEGGVAIWRLEDAADARSLRLLYANPAASRTSGIELSAVLGKSIGEIDPHAVEAGRHELLARVASRGVGESLEESGRKGLLDIRARLVPLDDRCVAVIAEEGATARRAEAEAERLATFLYSIVENIPAMVFVKDAEELRYQLFNRGAERLTGRRRQDVLGRNARDVGLPPEQAAFFEKKDREVLDKGVLVDIPEEPVQTDDGERRWLHTKKIPILDAAGRQRYLLGISLDITEAKLATEALKSAHEELERRVIERTADLAKANAELTRQIQERRRTEEALERTETQLRQAQKMEAIGRLAGGIAHDFNNLLSVIIGCAAMLSANGELGAKAAQEVEEIRRAGERAADLTRQLLAFGRQQVRTPTVINLNDVIARMDRMLRRVIGEDIELRIVQPADLGAIKADANQIEQVIMNLVVNARDAMPDGGWVRLETTNVYVDEDLARTRVGLSPGPYVMLAVTDAGVGIDPQLHETIFEPFFTTKGPGKGTGLGLPTVFGIVKQSGGCIFVDSRPGEGATFCCYFPRSDEAPIDVPASSVGNVLSGSETILVVEDDDQVRRLVTGILEQSGYRVLDAPGPLDALRAASQLGGPIHLLITDVVMPNLNGRQLADRLRAVRPDTRVLYMSGYSDHILDRDGVLEPGLHVLPKPITPATLTRAVRCVLDGEQRNAEGRRA